MIEQHATIDTILERHAAALGSDRTAYGNHVYRVLNFAVALAPDLDVERAACALAYHDLGIWTAGTWDYLPPSVALARAAGADEAVCIAIDQHHKIRPWRGVYANLVEPLRRADLVDVTFGVVRFGQPAAAIRAVQRAWPDAGFHRRLVTLAGRHLVRCPWRPMPMMRW